MVYFSFYRNLIIVRFVCHTLYYTMTLQSYRQEVSELRGPQEMDRLLRCTELAVTINGLKHIVSWVVLHEIWFVYTRGEHDRRDTLASYRRRKAHG